MASKLIRVIGITGIIFGVAAIFVSILAEWLGIDSEAGFSLNRLLLIIKGGGVFVAGFIVVISNPKKWTFVTEFGLLTLVASSIVIHSLIPFIAPQFSRIGHDADGYTKYALYLAGQKAVFSPNDFFREGDNNPHFIRLSIAVSPDGQKIASASGEGTVCIWDLHGKPIGQPFRGHEGPVTSIAFGKEGKVLASGGMDGTIRLWDLQGNPIGQPFRGHRGSVTGVAFDMEGKNIASGSMDNTVCLWDLQGNLIGQPFRGHEESVTSVAFGKDGKMIASASIDGRIRLWDIEGNIIGRQFGYGVVVESIAFGLDGHTIVSGGRDGTVRLWNLQGNPIGQPFRGHEGTVTSVAFGENGKMIASASEDGTIRLWDIQGTPIGIPYHVHEGITLSKGPLFFSFLPDYFRQPGYPLILSGFMHLTGQYNAGAAEICQPVILALIVVFSIRWVRKRFGLLYAITLGVLFLDPSNYLVTISRYDFADFSLFLFFSIILVLLYRTVLFDGISKYWFLALFVLIFLAASIKMLAGILVILVCFSILFMLCVGKTSRCIWADKYNLAIVSKKVFIIVLGTIALHFFHVTYISPGASIYNRQITWVNPYWCIANNNENVLMLKIRRMQELSNERHPSKEYTGAGLFTSSNHLPPIFKYLPVVGNAQKILIDSDNNKVLQLNPTEVEKGAYLLLKKNPFPFLYKIAKFMSKDCCNLFLYSEFGKQIFLYGVFCTVFFFVGVYVLCYYNFLITTSLCMSYTLFFILLSSSAGGLNRFLLSFAGFYYWSFVSGAVFAITKLYKK